MAKLHSFRIVPLIFIAVLLCVPVTVTAAQTKKSPLQLIKVTNDQAIYAQSHLTGEEQKNQLFNIMDSVTDWPQLAGNATEKICQSADVKACSRLQSVFSELLRYTAIKKLGRYKADSFDYTGEVITADEATVRTIAHYDDEDIPLHYQLQKKEDGWKVVNYVVDDIDTVKNYQRQFKILLKKGTVEDIIIRLQKRVDSFKTSE